jgi:ribosome biogenesis protein BRX1
MVFSSHGISSMFRHLVKDIVNLIPNTKVESKLERKGIRDVINDLCLERSCNNYIFFDCHKHIDLFMWLSKSPNGPSCKFQVKEVHTTQELKLTGNCLKYSRPLLSFDAVFDSEPHLKLAKEMFI